MAKLGVSAKMLQHQLLNAEALISSGAFSGTGTSTGTGTGTGAGTGTGTGTGTPQCVSPPPSTSPKHEGGEWDGALASTRPDSPVPLALTPKRKSGLVGSYSFVRPSEMEMLYTTQILQLEDELEKARHALELEREIWTQREKTLLRTVELSVTTIFSSLPPRCTAMESGKIRFSPVSSSTSTPQPVDEKEIRFQRTYQTSPKLLGWVVRPSDNFNEKLPPESFQVNQTGFKVRISQETVSSLVDIYWLAYFLPSATDCSAIAPILRAIETQSATEKQVAQWVKKNGISTTDAQGVSLLHAAAHAGNLPIVTSLLSRGAPINLADEHGWTPLTNAVSSGNVALTQFLLNHSADPKVISESHATTLHYLCRHSTPTPTPEYVGLLQRLVASGVDLNAQDKSDDTILHVIARKRAHIDLFRIILNGNGCNPNLVNKDNMTPFFYIVSDSPYDEQIPILTEFLEHGADIQAKTTRGTAQTLTPATNTKLLSWLEAAMQSSSNGITGLGLDGMTVGGTLRNSTNGKLSVKVISARSLHVEGGYDPYCKLLIDRKKVDEVPRRQHTSSPIWSLSYSFTASETSIFTVEVWGHSLVHAHIFLGEVRIPLGKIHETMTETWYPLSPGSHPEIGTSLGDIKLGLSLMYLEDSQTKTSDITEFVTRTLPDVEWVSETSTETLPFLDNVLQQGFHIESGPTNINGSPGTDPIFDETYARLFFADFFAGKDHTTFYGRDAGGPIIISLEDSSQSPHRRAIIRTKKENRRVVIPKSAKNELEALKAASSPLLINAKVSSSRSKVWQDAVLKFDTRQRIARYKFGMVYAKAGQKTEMEMLNNDDMSTEFDEFLNCLGDRITLQGWQKYTAGLDTTSNSTGTHSVYTAFENVEIMFHVATLLPNQPADTQKIERKRHIGNDIVVVLFKEMTGLDDKMDLLTFVSHFNHVFCIVSPITVAGQPGYKVCFCNRGSVRPFFPKLPSPAEFVKGPDFKQFLLTKLVNSERAAMEAMDFRVPTVNTRQALLNDIISTCTASKS